MQDGQIRTKKQQLFQNRFVYNEQMKRATNGEEEEERKKNYEYVALYIIVKKEGIQKPLQFIVCVH